MNGKLKDWYSNNAIGSNNATNVMDEPVRVFGKDTHPDVDNKNSTDHIESKFENAGEKPLNSSAAEQAISKLNESLAKGLNDSTVNAISSFGNGTTNTSEVHFNALKDGNNTEN